MHIFLQKQKSAQQITSVNSTTHGRAFSAQNHSMRSILHLQRAIGNHAVKQLLQSNDEETKVGSDSSGRTGFAHDFSHIPIFSPSSVQVQSELTTSTPGYVHEQEADRVAEQVMRRREPKLQRSCACGEGCSKYQREKEPTDHSLFLHGKP